MTYAIISRLERNRQTFYVLLVSAHDYDYIFPFDLKAVSSFKRIIRDYAQLSTCYIALRLTSRKSINRAIIFLGKEIRWIVFFLSRFLTDVRKVQKALMNENKLEIYLDFKVIIPENINSIK